MGGRLKCSRQRVTLRLPSGEKRCWHDTTCPNGTKNGAIGAAAISSLMRNKSFTSQRTGRTCCVLHNTFATSASNIISRNFILYIRKRMWLGDPTPRRRIMVSCNRGRQGTVKVANGDTPTDENGLWIKDSGRGLVSWNRGRQRTVRVAS